MEVLRVTDLSHRYASRRNEVEPLQCVDLTVEQGQFIAINGASGCGKTTLLLACGAMRRPTSGTVKIGGNDVYAMSTSLRATVRSTSIGYLFQTMELIPYLSVLDNLRIVPGAETETAMDWLEKLGLLDRASHRPDSLSQGEMQRAALARAMIHNPMLLIADEPTGNLDPENTARVFEAMKLFAEQGGAVLVATHEKEIADVVSATYRMESGRLRRYVVRLSES